MEQKYTKKTGPHCVTFTKVAHAPKKNHPAKPSKKPKKRR